MVKNPNWLEADQSAIYRRADEFSLGLPKTNPANGRVERLDPGLQDYKASALNHSATLPAIKAKQVRTCFFEKNSTVLKTVTQRGLQYFSSQ